MPAHELVKTPAIRRVRPRPPTRAATPSGADLRARLGRRFAAAADPELLLAELVLLELAVERFPVEPENLRRFGLVALDGLEHAQHVPAFDFLERDELGRIVARHEHV